MAASYSQTTAPDGSRKIVNAAGELTDRLYTVTGDNSYPTGGYAVSVSVLLGLRNAIHHIPDFLLRKSDNSDAVVMSYDATNGKLIAYQSTTGAPAKLVQVANTTDLSSYSGRMLVMGK